MKVITKRPADWTPENIANFWDWYSKNAARQQVYFTYVMAPGIYRFLKNKGLLKGNVLDYGCGSGHLLQQMIKENGVDFYGLDFSADSIKATQQKLQHNSNLKQLVLVSKLPSILHSDFFDTVTVIETLEHLQDDTLHATMNELHRILKNNGRIFITTPFNENLESCLDFCPFCNSEFHHMQHMQTFTVESLTALAMQHGFAVEYCENINIEKLRLGAVKFFIKKTLKQIAVLTGLKEKSATALPNLVAIFSKQ